MALNHLLLPVSGIGVCGRAITAFFLSSCACGEKRLLGLGWKGRLRFVRQEKVMDFQFGGVTGG